MDFGDVSWEIFKSGSTATSAATVHSLFGNYQGLSILNAFDVVSVHVLTTGSTAFIGTPGNVSNNIGLKLDPAASLVKLKDMRASLASQLQFARDDSTDTTARWVVWRRII